MKSKLALVLSTVSLLCLASLPAQAGVARHERVDLKEVKKGGEVVGVKLKLLVHPESYGKVRIGLSPAGKAPAGNKYQPAASDLKAGHLLHQFDEIVLEAGKPKSVELTVMFKDNPKLKAGQPIEVVSAFPNSGSGWHVFGMTRRAVTVESYKLPGKAVAATAKRKTSIDDIRRAGKRVKQQTARRRATRKTTTRKASRARKQTARKATRARARR